MTRALLTILLVSASSAVASADGADSTCADEEEAVRKLSKRDTSLAPPTDKTAAEHVKEGNRAYRAGDFEKAIEAYTAAAMRDDAPVLLYNLGQANRKSKQYDKAIHQYRLFLDRGNPGKELRALIECNVQMMTAELESAAAKQPPQEPAPEGPVGPVVPPPVDDEPVDEEPAETAPPWYADGLGWGLTGGGVVLGAVGGFFLFDAASLDDQADREDRDDVRRDLRDRADQRRTMGFVVGAVGVATLATGIVKLVLTPDATAREEDEMSLVVGASYVGLAGTF